MADGFSILEMVLALGVISLLCGVTVLSLGALRQEEKLGRVAHRLQREAREAMREAMISQQVRQVHLRADGFSGGGSPGAERWSRLPAGMRLEVQRWGEKGWRQPRKGETWEFAPGRPCEPLAVRLRGAEGSHALYFDALTAAPLREEIEIAGGAR